MSILVKQKSRDARRCVSISIIVLFLILSFGNCITTTSYYPEGIENKTVTAVDKSKLSRPKVNITISGIGNWSSILSSPPLPVLDADKANNYNVFMHDFSSPIFLKVNRSMDGAGDFTMSMCFLLPCFFQVPLQNQFNIGQKINL